MEIPPKKGGAEAHLRELGYQTRLGSILTNTWMNNVTYLATMAHIGCIAAVVLGLARFIHTPRYMTIMSAIFVVAAAIKEFWYDARYELPPQSTKDNVQDFVGYLGGISLAWLVISLSGGIR